MKKVTLLDMLHSWQDAIETLGITAGSSWTELGDIARVLNILHHGYVNVLLPTGGDMEFTGAAVSRSAGCLDLGIGGPYITVRAIRLTYDRANDDPRWSYMRLECAKLVPDAGTTDRLTPIDPFESPDLLLEPVQPPPVAGCTEKEMRAQFDLRHSTKYSWSFDGPITFLPKGSGCLDELLPKGTGHTGMSADELKSFVEQLAAKSTLPEWRRKVRSDRD